MGLAETVGQGALAAFKAIGNIARPATYIQFGGKTIDVNNGTTSNIETQTPIPKAVFVNYDIEEIDHTEITSKDQKVIFPLSYLSFTPTDSDFILDFLGRRFQIKRVRFDPAYAIAILQVRLT